MKHWWIALIWLGMCLGCGAQGSLPEAPGRASVSGTVLDTRGEPVPGAQVTLTEGAKQTVVDSDAAGVFRFEGLPVETVRVTVTAKGLETFISNDIKLVAGEHFQLPRIDLPLAPLNSDVTVTVTEDQLATEQVHEQEKQRLLGILPNFYTSYLWDAAPMRSKQKYQLLFASATDPAIFITVGIRAGVEQWRNTYPGYGDGFPGFARRYGAAYGDAITGRLVGGALLPSLLHQDPRYFYKGSGGTLSRVGYAMTRVVVTRGDNGKAQPNYSGVAGSFAGAGLRNLYLDPDDRKGVDVLLNGFSSMGFNAVANLLREFALKRASTHVPSYKNGKSADAGE